ncbi:hypothetical protein AB4Y96_18815 [Phyllobacterium sp. TAF24]|uniref:hypothetical protein n=1 Tax=unclassified Phyllobacterium TaxID=2638441 RepID=UPI0008860954|nr:hypothetical protein [Phyllobacterium sp. OV277]SDO57532.1 hypothetical protein SAMN05443582_102535 [Phyllobacterium sp. OV277]
MIRLIIILALLVLVLFLIYSIVGSIRKKQIDWTGIGVAIALIALALYLRGMTGIGGVSF